MRNMFLGSEMMFDMIRNYFGVESDDFIFRPLRGRFDDSLPMGTPSPSPWEGRGIHTDYLAVASPGGYSFDDGRQIEKIQNRPIRLENNF